MNPRVHDQFRQFWFILLLQQILLNVLILSSDFHVQAAIFKHHPHTHMHNFGKNEWTFPDDSVGCFMGVDAWLSLSINVTVNQMISPHHQTHKEPVEPKWQETLNLVASRPKLCNNCSTLMNSNPELLHPVISKQRPYFSFKCSLRLWYFS